MSDIQTPGWDVLLCEERPPHGARAWVGMVAACCTAARVLHCRVFPAPLGSRRHAAATRVVALLPHVHAVVDSKDQPVESSHSQVREDLKLCRSGAAVFIDCRDRCTINRPQGIADRAVEGKTGQRYHTTGFDGLVGQADARRWENEAQRVSCYASGWAHEETFCYS